MDQLAAKNMDLGRYYLEKRNYAGAINRFKTVVTQFRTTHDVAEALMRLTTAYLAIGITREAQSAAAVLSPWYKEASDLLKSARLEPREDEGNWISRAFK